MTSATAPPAKPPSPNGRLPLSCFIIAKNEADRIARTIASVIDFVDEVIVIEAGSTDDTLAVATLAGARVITHAWPGFGQQKRFGEDQCKNDWLLNLDADEVVTPELRDAIAALFAGGTPPLSVYGMDVNIIYPGRTRPRPFPRDHYCLRLYDRRKARFKDSTLYDSVAPGDAEVGHLPGGLDHYSVRSLDDLIRKSDERATYNATHSKPRSRAELVLRVIFELPIGFLKYYLVRTHITGGLMGFQFALITSFYRWVRIIRMLAKHDSPQT